MLSVVQCTPMKRYTVAQVREQLATALDDAERGEPIIIERRGVRFLLAVETKKPRSAPRQSRIETLDPAVASGQWTWVWTAKGLRFKGRQSA
jgi:antitoxin (DNA-binding transcriptional repressor) of toxin-antitoxin stability system